MSNYIILLLLFTLTLTTSFVFNSTLIDKIRSDSTYCGYENINLSALSLTNNQQDYIYKSGTSVWSLNICGNTSTPAVWNYDNGASNSCFNLGMLDTEEWSESGAENAVVTYKNGDLCNVENTTKPFSIQIEFICDVTTVAGIKYVDNNDGKSCLHQALIGTKYACMEI